VKGRRPATLMLTDAGRQALADADVTTNGQ
jgi:hypothetical protein